MCKVLESEEKRCLYDSSQILLLGKFSKTETMSMSSMSSPSSVLNDGSFSIDNNGGINSGVGGSSGNVSEYSVSNNNGDNRENCNKTQ